MIDIPCNVQIMATIERGSVYYFSDEGLLSAEPHYFVVLNKNPKTGNVLILACATSKIEKRKEIARRLKFPLGTLVEVSPSDFSFFTTSTLFDCNCIVERSTQSVIDKLSKDALKICPESMPEHIVSKLIEGVILSPQVPEGNKKIMQS